MFGPSAETAKPAAGPPQSDVPLPVALAMLGAVGAIFIALKQPDLSGFYAQHFETLWLSLAAVVMVAAGVCYGVIAYYTRDFTKRVRLTRPFWRAKGGILVGSTEEGTKLYIPDSVRTEHVQILGATGRGKTESVILPWLARDLGRGKSAILVDGKGDPELVERVRQIVTELKSPPEIVVLTLGDLERSSVINPLAGGSVQQITDRIFTAFQFDDEYYRAVQYDIARDMIALIHEVDGGAGNDGTVTFRRLFDLLTQEDVLADAVGKSKDHSLKGRLCAFLSEPRKDRDQRTRGLVSQLGPFAVGEVAHLVNGPDSEDNRRFLNVSDVILNHQSPIVFILLIPTLKYQEIGHRLGKLVLQEIGWAIGERSTREGAPCEFLPVFLDEFSAFVYPGFANILNKARSSNVAMHLAHQSMGDLAQVSQEFATVVNTNTNVKCLLGLNDPVTADFFAKHLGTDTEEKLTERGEKKLFGKPHKSGDVSVREVEAYKIHPNRLKNYTQGRGVLHFPTSRGNLTEEILFARLGSDELNQNH